MGAAPLQVPGVAAPEQLLYLTNGGGWGSAATGSEFVGSEVCEKIHMLKLSQSKLKPK